jgi:class 3 adenylate cyclase
VNPPESWLELPDGRTFLLKGRCAIGRQPDNDLVIEQSVLSRHHSLVAADGGVYLLSDLHSRNGTYVNGAPVTRPVALRDADEIRLGSVALRFRCKRAWFAMNKDLPSATLTERLDQVSTADCWLLLIDVVADPTANPALDQEDALRRRQTWIVGLRPLIEANGGRINGYLGDAIFAYWLCDTAKALQVSTALQAIERWRPRSPFEFRMIVHHGRVLFTRSDRGEELAGEEVNFLARCEKIAKAFAAPAMLSPPALQTLELGGRCECYGRSGIDGMKDFYSFYAPPRDWTVRD